MENESYLHVTSPITHFQYVGQYYTIDIQNQEKTLLGQYYTINIQNQEATL